MTQALNIRYKLVGKVSLCSYKSNITENVRNLKLYLDKKFQLTRLPYNRMKSTPLYEGSLEEGRITFQLLLDKGSSLLPVGRLPLQPAPGYEDGANFS